MSTLELTSVLPRPPSAASVPFAGCEASPSRYTFTSSLVRRPRHWKRTVLARASSAYHCAARRGEASRRAASPAASPGSASSSSSEDVSGRPSAAAAAASSSSSPLAPAPAPAAVAATRRLLRRRARTSLDHMAAQPAASRDSGPRAGSCCGCSVETGSSSGGAAAASGRACACACACNRGSSRNVSTGSGPSRCSCAVATATVAEAEARTLTRAYTLAHCQSARIAAALVSLPLPLRSLKLSRGSPPRAALAGTLVQRPSKRKRGSSGGTPDGAARAKAEAEAARPASPAASGTKLSPSTSSAARSVRAKLPSDILARLWPRALPRLLAERGTSSTPMRGSPASDGELQRSPPLRSRAPHSRE
mmetsp:Transcript_10009/g.36570  ORF Transcript_10009/g.36570 Transcript_10009/m.36570 type:complete len:364 (-) Transcript_10009:110-1201(-)